MPPVSPRVVDQRLGPLALFPRLRIRQRRPIGCGRFPRRTGVPRADSAVEIRGLVRPVGPGRELVDRRRVDGVLAFLHALDVAILAAPRAEEVALQPLAIRTSSTAAAFDKMSPASAATCGSPGQASCAGLGELPVLLDRDGVFAPALRTARPGLRRQDGVRDEARRDLPAPLGDEGLKVHDVLRFRVATLECVGPERAARARRAVTSRQRGRSEAENLGKRPVGAVVSGLTAGARVRR